MSAVELHDDEISVSVLVPILNEARHLPRVLRAMEGQVGCGDAEFLLIDGGSADGTPDIVAAASARDPALHCSRTRSRPLRRH